MKKKTQMKKTNVENFKGVTHEIEFMFFFRFSSVITCGKLIGYEKVRDYIHKYVSHYFANRPFRKSMNQFCDCAHV